MLITEFELKEYKTILGIAKDKLYSFTDENIEIPIEYYQSAIIQFLNEWWDNRTIEINTHIYPVSDSDPIAAINQRSINTALSLGEDADLIDIDDATVNISAANLKAFAKQLKIARKQALDTWDEKIAKAWSEDKNTLIQLIQEILALP